MPSLSPVTSAYVQRIEEPDYRQCQCCLESAEGSSVTKGCRAGTHKVVSYMCCNAYSIPKREGNLPFFTYSFPAKDKWICCV